MTKLPIVLDSHSKDNFHRCEKLYELANIENLEPKKPRVVIEKGTLWHEIMRLYNLARLEQEHVPNEQANKIAQEVTAEASAEKKIPAEDCMAIYKRFLEYLKHYKNRRETIVAVEQGFSKQLYKDDYSRYILEGRIDAITDTPGVGVAWKDYKSQGSKHNSSGWTNQFIKYSWAVGCNMGFIEYVTWSKSVTENTFRTIPVSHVKEVLKRWKKDTIQTFHRLKNCILNQRFQRSWLCEGKYGLCVYHKICTAQTERQKEFVIKRDFVRGEKWRPW